MKKIMTFIALCIGYSMALPIYAQIGMPSRSIVNPDSVSCDFYRTETVTGNTITFKVNHSLSTLYQITDIRNTMVFAPMPLNDGVTRTEPLDLSLTILPVSTEPIFQAFLDTFSPDEIRTLALYKEYLSVNYALTTSGSVMEIGFTIPRDHPRLYNIPPQYLEKLSAKLKNSVSFSVPRSLNIYKYVTLTQDVYFSFLVDKL